MSDRYIFPVKQCFNIIFAFVSIFLDIVILIYGYKQDKISVIRTVKASAASTDKLLISILLLPVRVLPACTVILLTPMLEMEVRYRSITSETVHFHRVPRPRTGIAV